MATVDDLVTFCDTVVMSYDRGPRPIRCPLGSLVHQLEAGDNAAWAALQAGFAEWKALLISGLQRVIDSGGITGGVDPDVLATGFLAAYQGGILLAEVIGDVEPLRQALRQAMAALPVARTS
jgi:TetR/AcrR family transcriptional repressor of nem operon